VKAASSCGFSRSRPAWSAADSLREMMLVTSFITCGSGRRTSVTRAAERGERGDRGPHARLHLRVDPLKEEVLGDADPQRADGRVERREIVGHRPRARGGVERVRARHRLQHERAVLRGARHRPEVIVRPGERHAARAAHPAIGRLESGDAAGRRGQADRSAGVGADRAVREPRGHRHTRSARRAARAALGVPRVAGVAVMRVVAEGPHGELGHVELAEGDRARADEPGHRGAVVLGGEVPGGPVPQEVGSPWMKQRSLNAIGTPWSGPRASCRPAASRRRAASSAPSASTVMKARSRPSSRSTRARHSRVASTGETLPARMAAARAATVGKSVRSRLRAARETRGGDEARRLLGQGELAGEALDEAEEVGQLGLLELVRVLAHAGRIQ